VISLVEIESGADPRSVLPTLNKLVTPEIAVHLAATVMLAVLLNYVEFLINLPLLYLHLSAYVPVSCACTSSTLSKRTHTHSMRAKKHLFDPTTIFSTIYAKKRASIIKLSFYMLVFFFYLFRYAAASLPPACSFDAPTANVVRSPRTDW